MKNRVIVNSQGVPVVPSKSKEIENKVAESDFRAELKRITLASFETGIETGMDAYKVCLETAKKAGHAAITIDDAIKLADEVTRMCKENMHKI